MSITDAFRGFWQGLTKGGIPVVGGGNKIPVAGAGTMIPAVDARQVAPTQGDIPSAWTRSFMGPGAPMMSLTPNNLRDKDVSQEPRTFDFQPSINATISPRISYGLTAFTELRRIAESLPEVAMCVRILTEEIKSFEPRILDPNGAECKDPALRWMYTTPDLFNPWPVWLSRFLYNVLVYDAGAIYRPRDSNGHVMALRVIDGSTLFVLINEWGEQPAPPAPAFIQVIHGIPREPLNTHQIWYRPRHLRADAPYGRSPIEDALPAVQLLERLWQYEVSWYTEGNTPEQVFTAPQNYTAEQILAYEDAYNGRMAGNSGERSGRGRFMPYGTTSLALKDARFREDVYRAASTSVRMAYGIPLTETGESPGNGLGGTGFLDAMQSLFYRLGLAPVKSYIESLFNETLEENGYPGYKFDLAFPKESLDPKKEEDKVTSRWEKGLIRRDEAREGLGMKPVGGEEGATMLMPGQGAPVDGGGFGMGGFGSMGGGIPVSNKVPVSGRAKIPVKGEAVPVKGEPESESAQELKEYGRSAGISDSHPILVRKMNGLEPEDDAYFGAPVKVDNGMYFASFGKLEPRQVFWDEGDSLPEAVYHLDRAMAANDERYLVPMAYQQSVNGKAGLVRSVAWHGEQKSADAYGEDWIEQAAMLDYITGAERSGRGYAAHMDDADRPVMMSDVPLFGDPAKSDFVKTYAGRELSKTAVDSIHAVIGDHALWRDITDIVGADRAMAARKRAAELHQAGAMPILR